MTQNSAKDSELNTLKTSKTNSQQNSDVQLSTINENVSISHDIQIHQDADSLSMNQVVVRYSAVWSESEQVIDILKKYWMKICFKNNWKFTDTKLKHKLYSMLVNECTVIDETLDKLHDQKKTYWTQSSAFYVCSVFMTWQTVYKNEKSIWKNWAVIDLQELN